MGLVALDQGALQHQGLKLRLDHNHVKVVDLGHHSPGLFVVAGGVLKILAHPVFQRLGLSHIDDPTLGVLHDVHARLQRQGVRLVPQFFQCHAFPSLCQYRTMLRPCRVSAANCAPARQRGLWSKDLAAGGIHFRRGCGSPGPQTPRGVWDRECALSLSSSNVMVSPPALCHIQGGVIRRKSSLPWSISPRLPGPGPEIPRRPRRPGTVLARRHR